MILNLLLPELPLWIIFYKAQEKNPDLCKEQRLSNPSHQEKQFFYVLVNATEFSHRSGIYSFVHQFRSGVLFKKAGIAQSNSVSKSGRKQ